MSCHPNAPSAAPSPGFPGGVEASGAHRPRGAPATPRAGPGPITARGRRSSSRRRRSTGRRRCRHGGGRSSAPGSPSSRAGAQGWPPPPWPGRASRRTPGKVPGPRGSPASPIVGVCGAARRPLVAEPGAAAAQRRAPPAPHPFAGPSGSRVRQYSGAAKRSWAGWGNPEARGPRLKKCNTEGWGEGRRGHTLPLLPLFPPLKPVKGTPCATQSP